MCSIQAKQVTVVANKETAVASEQLEASERQPTNIVSHLALLSHPLQAVSTTTAAQATAEGHQRGRLTLSVARQLQSLVQKAGPAATAQATEEGRQRGRLAISRWD
jgi:hypothetical protein